MVEGGKACYNVFKLVNVPAWAFHRENDLVLNVEESVKMVNLVNEYGGNAKLLYILIINMRISMMLGAILMVIIKCLNEC